MRVRDKQIPIEADVGGPIKTSNPKPAKDTASIKASELAGIYVAKLAIPGPYLAAEIRLAGDGTYTARIANMSSGPAAPMQGTWKYAKGVVTGAHTAPGLGKVTIELDVRGKAKGDLASGVDATLTSAALGGSVPFKVTKTDKPFFG